MAYKFNAFTGNFDIDTTSGAGIFAPVGAQYLTLAADGTLTDERVLTAGTGITFVDGGAGAALTVSLTVPLQESQTRHYIMALMGA